MVCSYYDRGSGLINIYQYATRVLETLSCRILGRGRIVPGLENTYVAFTFQKKPFSFFFQKALGGNMRENNALVLTLYKKKLILDFFVLVYENLRTPKAKSSYRRELARVYVYYKAIKND